MNSRERMSFPGGDVPIPQPTRSELIINATEWLKTSMLMLEGFEALCASGDREGCKTAIRSFMASAQMVADRMLEASP